MQTPAQNGILPPDELKNLAGVLVRAGVKNASAAAEALSIQCGSLLIRNPIDQAGLRSRVEIWKSLPAEWRRVLRLDRGPEPRHARRYFVLWARYWIVQAGVRNAIGERTHLVQCMDILLRHATQQDLKAWQLLKDVRKVPLFPPPGKIRMGGF